MNKKNTFTAIPRQLIESLSFETSAKQLELLIEHIFHLPEINQAKIAFLKDELAANRYEIHSNRIAAKLL
jgi:negative regulator of flagellin synthesis FlgM